MTSKNYRVSSLVAMSAVMVSTIGMATTAQATTLRSHVAIPPFSIRLEDQFLATLHYLPVNFVPSSSATTTTSTTTTTTTTSTTTTTTLPNTTSTTTTTTDPVVKKPVKTPKPTALVAGTFVWKYPALNSILRSQWQVGTDNVVLQGALMRFQDVHNLTTTGQMNGSTWTALSEAVLAHHANPASYNDVYVSIGSPEKVTLYENGKKTFSTLANTGVSDAPTESGTYPVYLRFTVTTMSGVEPDGQTYDDPGIPWVSYFHGGDALHGFIRSSYGYPQSLGCVEMPFAEAGVLWPHTPIGTLVTVQ